MNYENLLALRLVAETNADYIKKHTCYTIEKLEEEIQNHDDVKSLESEYKRLEMLKDSITKASSNELRDYEDAIKDSEKRIAFYEKDINEDAPTLAVKLASLISEESVNAINENGIFAIELVAPTQLKMSLVGTVSKAVFKELVELSGQKRFNKDDFRVNLHDSEKLQAVIKKSTKLSQNTLETILKCRLEGLYKGKFKEGKTWNKGGIDKA